MNDNHIPKPFIADANQGLFTNYLLDQMPDFNPVSGLRNLVEEAANRLKSAKPEEDCEMATYPMITDAECAC